MVQFFSEFWAVALPIIIIAAGVATVLFLFCFAIYRWQRFTAFLHRIGRLILRRPQYDYSRIFQVYLERFNAISDRRELYDAILDLTSKMVDADGASLLVVDSKGNFSVKSYQGTRPFSFDMSDLGNFVAWLAKRRWIVTRRYLLHSKRCRDIKIEGLRYCVQFNAEVCVPVFVDGKLYALLNLGDRVKGIYDRETRSLLSLMAVQYSSAIHNANLCQEMIKQNIQLKQAWAFRNQLLANLSHELRTPLNSIIGLSEAIAEGGDGPVNADQVNHLSMIRQSGIRLLDTVNAMLDLSKIESNRLELDVRKISLSRLVGDVSSRVKLSDHTKLIMDLQEQVPGVYGDENRLRQVIRQLLDNAAKFTKRGKITVSAARTGEMLKVCVKDTGSGISREVQKNVFNGFYQVDSGANREHEGLGIGLTIARKIVELHGGHMWCKSKKGQGSEFYFTLPLKPTGVRYNETL